MRAKARFLLAILLSAFMATPVFATDYFTWKPGKFKISAGGLPTNVAGRYYGTFYPISTLRQNTTYTFPDPGGATATVAILGAQTFTGVQTFTALPVFSTKLTSAALAPDVIQHATVPLSSANLLAMYATPVQLIAAGAAGTNIVVHKVMFTMVRTATAYAAGGVIEFQIGNTANGAGTATTGTVAASVLTTAGAATTYNTVIPVAYAGTSATGLFISNQTAAFTTGTGTAVADIWYSVQ